MSKLLIHTCCGPCLIAPYEQLKQEGEFVVDAYWFNDNIHPYKEYEARLLTLEEWSEQAGVPLIIEDIYNPKQFMRRINFREEERCFFCYYFRLWKTADRAKKDGYDAFTTTLLYSKYQKHNLIKKIGLEMESRFGVQFYYRDFRDLWGRGIKLSKQAGMYRQQYCGCLYSEAERYDRYPLP